eukprot:scaffold40278_cov35-Tisochrysis_lutea.AAC.1
MGNNDVIPKGEPLTHEWLHEVGSFLLERNWLTRKEMSTWVDGGFFWRMIHHTGLCAVGLNSNHWTPTQVGIKNSALAGAPLRSVANGLS